MSGAMVQALALAGQGRLPECREALLCHLAVSPNDADALRLLGKVLFTLGDKDDGLAWLSKAVALRPDDADIHYEVGVMRLGQNDLAAAIKAFQQVVALRPDHDGGLFNLAWAFRQSGHLNDAAAAYERLLKVQPGRAAAWLNLGNIWLEQSRLDQAGAALRRGLEIAPGDAALLTSLADCRFRQGHAEDAIVLWRAALAAVPGQQVASCKLGSALSALNRSDEAVAVYAAALQHHPDDATLLYNLAVTHLDARRFSRAESVLQHLLGVAPDMALAWNALGALHLHGGNPAMAEPALRRAVALDPALGDAQSNLAKVLTLIGRQQEARIHFELALSMEPDNAAIHTNLLFLLRHLPNLAPQEVFAEHCRFGRRQQELAGPVPAFPPRAPDRRLRIGYVSPDFCDHAVTMFFEPVLEAHDRTGFEIFCYHTSNRRDAVTERLCSLAEHWRSIAHLSADAAAALIRTDGIDVLVDLAGHTAGNGLPIFARKPAPAQATWLGYPGTTGLDRMDYRLTDLGVDSIERTGPYHTEQLAFLPCGSVFRPPLAAPEVTPPPCLDNGYIRFGSFNKLGKVNDDVLDVWVAILLRQAGSRLLMVVPDGDKPAVVEWLQQEFSSRGVDPARLEIRSQMPLLDFLEAVASVDIALDPFPYSGGSTSVLTLWMGVPLISMIADEAHGRTTSLMLRSMEAPELEAADADEYVDKALALATDLERLINLRASLRPRLLVSALMDAETLVDALEDLYRRWCGPSGRMN